MKHPSNKILQDYFENEFNDFHSERVSDHLLNCSECTEYLEFLAKSNVQIKNISEQSIKENKKNKIFTDAFAILDQRAEKIETKNEVKQKRIEKIEQIGEAKDRFFDSEFIVMARCAGVAAVFIFGIAINSFKTVKEEYQLIETRVLDYSENRTTLYTAFGAETVSEHENKYKDNNYDEDTNYIDAAK